MGDICTRNCRFCAVKKGKPLPLDKQEPKRLALLVKKLKLKYVVITSPTRDDLVDGGASHFVATIRAIREINPGTKVEVLIPDFIGENLKLVMAACPDVLNHNVETVPSLYKDVRPMASYKRSLSVLYQARNLITKSGFMLGLGEKFDEIISVMRDLRNRDVDILTIGQYLRPPGTRLMVKRYVTLEEFDKLRNIGYKMGFKYVASGPYVRSSYHAREAFDSLVTGEKLK
jgi:lipoic acid synthetase